MNKSLIETVWPIYIRVARAVATEKMFENMRKKRIERLCKRFEKHGVARESIERNVNRFWRPKS